MTDPEVRPTLFLPLLVGVARACIDPPLGISHGNWGAQKHVHASGRHRRLDAFVLLLRRGDVTVAICDVDLCLLREEARSIREAVAKAIGTTVENVRVSTSHTHSGPELSRSLLADDPSVELAYLGSLPHLVAGAALEAADRLTPARVRAGQSTLRYAVNRRQILDDSSVVVGCNWDGTTDHTVPVVRFDVAPGARSFDSAEGHARDAAAESGVRQGRGAAGVPIAVLFGYAMHPTILGYENQLLSPDYPGVARDVVNDVVGAPALFLQGCAGDQGPGPEGFTDDLEAAERAGRALGAAASTALIGLGTAGTAPSFDEVVMSGATLGRWRMNVEPDDGTPLRLLSREIALPVKRTGTVEELRAQFDALRRERDQVRASGGSDETLVDLTWRTKRAHIQLRQALDCQGLSHKPIDVQAIRIGDVALIGAPLELFADVGLRVKARSPFLVTHVSGYTNGSYGYLPNRQAYQEGGYEVESSYFVEGADEVLVDGMVALLEELAAEASGASGTTGTKGATEATEGSVRP